jgi:hypothetical protein
MFKRVSWGARALLLGMTIAAAPGADSAPPRPTLPSAEFLLETWSGGLTSNAAFVPGPDAGAAHAPFRGTVSLSESEMIVKPRKFNVPVLGRDPARFPGVSVSFFTLDGDLVPFTQDVIRYGSAAQGSSYWDLIVQPGRVWSEAGDGDWSRAAFPFALVNSIEGETHNGLATFLYQPGKVSNLRFQIVQQTAPFLVKDYFYAAGLVRAAFAPLPAGAEEGPARIYEASLAHRVPMADWSALAARVGAGRLAGFDGTMPARDVVLSGLDYDGTFYLKECLSAGGKLPWCDRARFGVWSVTKALANETALLRLAEKFGRSVFDLKIADYVPELAGHAGWERVRFQDAIDMATGMGNGSAASSPNDIEDGYLSSDYQPWYEARSTEEKLKALAGAAVYSWGPGTVARYRDQDMFLLGVAMDRYLKSRAGPSADIWSMLGKEVFEPIGIFYAPINRTLEPGGGPGQPLMAYGYYPTIGDMVKIARLYQQGGKQGETQILDAEGVAALFGAHAAAGLPTGEQLAFGETRYANAFWVAPFRAGNCEVRYPRMIGWGGNIVALLPNGMTGIRLAKSAATSGTADVETAGMATVADRLKKFCP